MLSLHSTHLCPQSQQQQTPLPVRQQLRDGLSHQRNKVLQHPIMLHVLVPSNLPHRRRQQAERRDEEAQGGEGQGGGCRMKEEVLG